MIMRTISEGTHYSRILGTMNNSFNCFWIDPELEPYFYGFWNLFGTKDIWGVHRHHNFWMSEHFRDFDGQNIPTWMHLDIVRIFSFSANLNTILKGSSASIITVVSAWFSSCTRTIYATALSNCPAGPDPMSVSKIFHFYSPVIRFVIYVRARIEPKIFTIEMAYLIIDTIAFWNSSCIWWSKPRLIPAIKIFKLCLNVFSFNLFVLQINESVQPKCFCRNAYESVILI